jgi:hypothetical protein
MPDDEDPRRAAAIRRLKEKRAFQQNVISYVVVNAFLVVIWAMTGAGFFWPGFVMAGWGIGVVLHAWTVYGTKPITEEQIQREIDKGRGDIVE